MAAISTHATKPTHASGHKVMELGYKIGKTKAEMMADLKRAQKKGKPAGRRNPKSNPGLDPLSAFAVLARSMLIYRKQKSL
jgi:hypothetical protein